MYVNELMFSQAMALSKKIEMVTKLQLKHEYYGSENFQIMNYGLGGKISPHVDSIGPNFGLNYSSMAEETFESLATGGNRFVTFMIYLSSVESGGSTIFTQPGIAIEPVAGNALFWFNQGAQDNYDSRIRHLGCPVLYGNKWIANKWVKWLPQFRNYPCLRKEYFYSVYRDQMSCYNSLE